MKQRTSLSFLALATAGALALTGCAGSSAGGSGSQGSELAGLSGEIGAKDFAEQYVLAHLTTELLNAHGADLTANTKLVGSTNVRQALENGDFIGYWEYTGTSWITYHGETEPVQGREAQYKAVKADELGVETLSDVAALPQEEQTFCIESEFSTRDDGWPGLTAAYNIDVPDSNVALLDTGVIYTATADGTDCNFGEVFQTDGRIQALDLVVMEDDLEFFPAYQGALTLSQSVLDEFPAIADVMSKLTPLLTTETMQELNAQVDVEGEEPRDVAIDFLEEHGLI